MRTPPADLDTATLVEAVHRLWGIRLQTATHQPVGFGSYHWLGEDGHRRWWITVDDLDTRRGAAVDSLDDAYAGLRAATAVEASLGDVACSFVIAPCRAVDGEPSARLTEHHAAVVHPYVDGRTHEWGEALAIDQRAAVVDLLAALHQVTLAAVPSARVDASGFDHRDELERAVTGTAGVGDDEELGALGPFAAPAASLVREHRDVLASALAQFDEQVAQPAATDPDRLVLTHGEPHPGNLIDVDGRWILIDWDTVRAAPPERDLWMLADRRVYPDRSADLDPADLDPVARYEAATGVTVDRNLLEAFRVRWDLADVASYLHRFGSPQSGTADDAEAWTNLRAAVDRLCGGAA